jgi:hypothetical protein
LEIACCPFLNLKLVVGKQAAEVRLELTGPPGAKEILREFIAPS